MGTGEEYDWVRAIVENSVPVSLSRKEIERASYDDEELSIVKSCVRSGNWNQCIVPAYVYVKDELCVYGKFLLRGTRIVIPRILRDRIVNIAHEGHQGVVKETFGGQRSTTTWRDFVKSAMVAKWFLDMARLNHCLVLYPRVARLQCGFNGTTALWRKYSSCD